MKLRQFLTEKGQTAIEYLLMVAMSAMMGVQFFKKFSAYMMENNNAKIRMFEQMFNPDLKFKKYRLPR